MSAASERVKLLLLRSTVTLLEAAEVVKDRLGGTVEYALPLVIEAVTLGQLPPRLWRPDFDTYIGETIGPVDAAYTTVTTRDLLAWLSTFESSEATAPPGAEAPKLQSPQAATPTTSDDDNAPISSESGEKVAPTRGEESGIGEGPFPTDNRRVTKNRIIGAFKVESDPDANEEFWKYKLSDPPRWLIGARVSSGSDGISSLWDPVSVAHALLHWKKKYMGIKDLDKVIQASFEDRWDQWQEETEGVNRKEKVTGGNHR